MRAHSLLAALSALTLTSAQDLATALSGEDSLSTLVDVLGRFPKITEFIVAQKDVTLFAPNNEAFASILDQGGIFSLEQAGVDPGLIEQILRYHLVRGAVPSSAVTEESQLVPTFLNYSSIVLDGEVSGSNVTGGQVLGVNAQDGKVVVTSGIKAESIVTMAVSNGKPGVCGRRTEADFLAQDIGFDNGVVHVIDKLLTIPLSVSVTLLTGNFTALAGAATELGLVPTLEGASDIPIFAPNNDAFQAIGGLIPSLSTAQLETILNYHVVPAVAYSTDLSNTSLPTLQGSNVNITVDGDGAAFVNGARIINTDIFIPGGVIHVIDSVLVPDAFDQLPEPVSGSFVPFTSDVPAPTSTYAELEALAATTSFVAAGLVTAASSVGAASVNGSMTMSAGMPAQQTGNAGSRKETPFLGAAVAIGAVAFAMDL